MTISRALTNISHHSLMRCIIEQPSAPDQNVEAAIVRCEERQKKRRAALHTNIAMNGGGTKLGNREWETTRR
jgi:hypothetical protein